MSSLKNSPQVSLTTNAEKGIMTLTQQEYDTLSQIQKDLLAVLSDGYRHLRKELLGVLPEPDGKSLLYHLSRIRKVLKPHGEGISCVYMERRIGYQYVRFIRKLD